MNDKYVLFGAGYVGKKALSLLGKDNVDCFIDNNIELENKDINGVIIHHYDKNIVSLSVCTIVITVSEKYYDEIKKQLERDGINNTIFFDELEKKIIDARIKDSGNNIEKYKKAINWIYENTIPGKGIINSTNMRFPYPEVTGYFIPTLLRWGHRDLALQYAAWLCDIQKPDGSWYNTEDTSPYIFDSAQILKGLISIRKIYKKADEHILKGCEWILSMMQSDGRLITQSTDDWGNDKDTCDEVIHIYCLSPIIEAGKIFGKQDYIDKANYIFEYYYKHYHDKIVNFSLLSHFYAYLMEALIDLDKMDILKEAMKKLESYQKKSGAVPAYAKVNWVCSTGLFQLAMIWYRIGEKEHGDAAFKYALSLQNPSGGWFGSYCTEQGDYPKYFEDTEISWANKFFLDALYYKVLMSDSGKLDENWKRIDEKDHRYTSLKRIMDQNGIISGNKNM